jgi:uncharacterized protein
LISGYGRLLNKVEFQCVRQLLTDRLDAIKLIAHPIEGGGGAGEILARPSRMRNMDETENAAMSKKSIVIFLSLLLLLSWAVQGLAIYFVRDLNSPRAMPWLITLMFFPTLAAVIYRFGFNREAFRRISFRPRKPLYLILAALIPAVIALATLATVHVAGWGRSDYFVFSPGAVEVVKGPWLLGVGSQSFWIFAANIAATAIVFALINSVTAVGEEFGWRGFLQRQMIERFGTLGGVTLLGTAWAFWHLPANLAGYNYPDTPMLGGLLLFPLMLISDSFIMAWLTIRGKSFWPAVLMHGSGNGVQEGILSHIALAENVSRLRVDLVAILVSAVLGLLCAWSLVRHPLEKGHRSGD